MLNQIPVEFISNIVSIILVFVLIYNYLKYKKIIDVIKKLDDLKIEKKLTSDDISYIFENEKEYNEKAQKTEAFAKFMNPLFILIVGILFIYLPFSDAMIHLNPIVVAFILIQLNKINMKNTHTLLKELKKELKKEEI